MVIYGNSNNVKLKIIKTMQSRKITIVSTKNQTKKVIMSSATTLAELKADLRQNGINYQDMTFYEGTSKVELKTDNSILPHDVPWKGTTTNELVFMLTNTNKKIKSGMAVNRNEIYSEIKKKGLQEACVKKFGRNYTMCKTVDLIALIKENSNSTKKESKNLEPNTQNNDYSQKNNDCDVIARSAIVKVVELLENNGYFDRYEKDEVLDTLGESVDICPSVENKNQSPYSDSEIDDMFNGMNI